jgi:hypothetical protein
MSVESNERASMKSLILGAVLVLAIAIGLAAHSPTPAAAADLDCADFSSQAEAQESLLPGDPYGLDGDGDGVACEDNPCPCSSATGGGGGGGGATEPEPPPPPPPYRLTPHDARAAALRLGRRLVRRSQRVESLAFAGCLRSGARRFDCDLTARGRSATEATTCALRVAVRARDRHPLARLASDCRTESLLRLTYAEAKRAMLEAAEPIAGKRVGLVLRRLNRLEFEGGAEWRRPGSPPAGPELCSLEMYAALSPTRIVRVETGEPRCVPL